ncbi:hypothetical protein [Methylobacterium dankookense]|jgi:hypothetical protein|uniref:Uncharacterized protein n=1 Tax=Methylobacterium dankookense TaxID=560405 RepID=A0A564G039_9HYPH|nr:hypothetical protein [Methylobacterium dankookense]GJD55567.1 hypothetical protein IFDJLNFL_1454 [Methylobacterium dankookense]VUF13833.1 hypothetical protein MTDSW087_03540 [Methylobacterium dankookense]
MPTVAPLVAASVFTGGCALIHLMRARADQVTKVLVAILLLVTTLGLVAVTRPDARNAWHLVRVRLPERAQMVPATLMRPGDLSE